MSPQVPPAATPGDGGTPTPRDRPRLRNRILHRILRSIDRQIAGLRQQREEDMVAIFDGFKYRDDLIAEQDAEIRRMNKLVADAAEAAAFLEANRYMRDQIATIQEYLRSHSDETAGHITAFAGMLDDLSSVAAGIGAVADGLSTACDRFRLRLVSGEFSDPAA